jgi:hypothetical protein
MEHVTKRAATANSGELETSRTTQTASERSNIVQIVTCNSRHLPIRYIRVNQWPYAKAPRFAGIMPVIVDPGVHEAAAKTSQQRKLDWSEILQVCKQGAN